MSDLAGEIAAILEAFTEEQRRRVLEQNRQTRITLTRTVSSGFQLGFETIVDQGALKDEIDELLDRMVGAAERQEAVAQLEQDIASLAIDEGILKGKAADLVRIRSEYALEAQTSSSGRRQSVGLSKQQQAHLQQLHAEIEELKRQVDRRRERMNTCRAVISGMRRLDVAEAQEQHKAAAEKAA
jgi:hypothetical protein